MSARYTYFKIGPTRADTNSGQKLMGSMDSFPSFGTVVYFMDSFSPGDLGPTNQC